jgi:hypothetical protein
MSGLPARQLDSIGEYLAGPGEKRRPSAASTRFVPIVPGIPRTGDDAGTSEKREGVFLVEAF